MLCSSPRCLPSLRIINRKASAGTVNRNNFALVESMRFYMVYEMDAYPFLT
jgi:hypothetical protein